MKNMSDELLKAKQIQLTQYKEMEVKMTHESNAAKFFSPPLPYHPKEGEPQVKASPILNPQVFTEPAITMLCKDFISKFDPLNQVKLIQGNIHPIQISQSLSIKELECIQHWLEKCMNLLSLQSFGSSHICHLIQQCRDTSVLLRYKERGLKVKETYTPLRKNGSI